MKGGFRGNPAVECAGETFGKWLVHARAGTDGDSATWEVENTKTGARRIMARRELIKARAAAERKSERCRPEPKYRPGAVIGSYCLVELAGKSGKVKSWRVRCLGCGAVSVLTATAIRKSEVGGSGHCANCRPPIGKKPSSDVSELSTEERERRKAAGGFKSDDYQRYNNSNRPNKDALLARRRELRAVKQQKAKAALAKESYMKLLDEAIVRAKVASQ